VIRFEGFTGEKIAKNISKELKKQQH
jgi:hypothetical protein